MVLELIHPPDFYTIPNQIDVVIVLVWYSPLVPEVRPIMFLISPPTVWYLLLSQVILRTGWGRASII